MNLLVIDCCIRGEHSATRKLYESYLTHLPKEKEVHLERLVLSELPIQGLDAKALQKRDLLVREGRFDHEIFQYARQFRDADEILIAAPYWDLSFPALLKVYFEQICVSGLTFGYEGSACVGYCKAKRLLYFSTCGGFTGGKHLGEEYVRALSEMLGVREFHGFSIEGMDIDPSKREELLENGIQRILKCASLYSL